MLKHHVLQNTIKTAGWFNDIAANLQTWNEIYASQGHGQSSHLHRSATTAAMGRFEITRRTRGPLDTKNNIGGMYSSPCSIVVQRCHNFISWSKVLRLRIWSHRSTLTMVVARVICESQRRWLRVGTYHGDLFIRLRKNAHAGR